MANVVNTQILVDGARNTVIKVTGVLDTANLTNVVIVDPAFVDRVFDFGGTVLVRGDGYESALAPMPDTEPPHSDEDAPLVIHTSGTTGHPKGAERKFEATDPSSLVGFCARVPIAPGDTVVVPAPLFHALGFFGTGVALAVGASVAVTGAIAFVGLIVPHLCRPFVGHMPSRLLWPSAIGGALLVSIADTVVRLVPSGPELMLGVFTSLIGVPFFIVLILLRRDRA